MSRLRRLISLYSGVGDAFSSYWVAYGGLSALLKSAYFHFAVIVTAVLWPRWTGDKWPEDVITILPSIMGFSLGGYAILLAFGDADFLKELTKPTKATGRSYFESLNTSFVHFIVVQMLAIFLSLIGLSYIDILPKYISWPMSAIFYLLFVYALATAIAATMAIFRFATIFGIRARRSRKSEDPAQRST